jgi:hypothetical protein
MREEATMMSETRQSALALFEERVAPYGVLHRLCWQGYIQARGREGWLFAALQQYYAVRATQPLLAMAGDVASGYPELRDYADWAYRHAEEERPHAAWFRNDLVHMGIPEDTIDSTIPEEEVLNLLGVQFSLVASVHPAALLGYLYTTEARPANAGALKALAAKLNIPIDGLSTLLYHTDIDREHRRDVLRLLGDFVEDPLCFEAMLTGAVRFLAGWSGLFRRKT